MIRRARPFAHLDAHTRPTDRALMARVRTLPPTGPVRPHMPMSERVLPPRLTRSRRRTFSYRDRPNQRAQRWPCPICPRSCEQSNGDHRSSHSMVMAVGIWRVFAIGV